MYGSAESSSTVIEPPLGSVYVTDSPTLAPVSARPSGLFAGLLVAIGFALFDRLSGDQVRARVIDFQVLSDDTVRIDLEVLKPEGAQAYCIVRSRGVDGAEVGRDIVVVDARGTDERTVRVEHDLATTARANTGEAGRCSATPIPSRPPAP